MSSKTGFALITVTLILTISACTIQGLPYPTSTPGLDARATQAEATREIAEAGMSPSSTPQPLPSTTTDEVDPSPTTDPPTPVPAPTGIAFRIPSQTLKLVYLIEGNLWYWEEGQSPNQLTHQGDATLVAISDDASQIAYARELNSDNRELWAVNSNGNDARVLVDSAAFKEMVLYADDLTGAPLQLDWVPGTDLVLFSTRLVFEYPGLARKHELRTVHSQSRTMTVLADIDQGGLFTIAPDGHQIAISLPDSINLVDAIGNNFQELFNFPHIITDSEWWYYPSLVWTQDSSSIRMILPPEHPMFDQDLPAQIISLPVDGSSPRYISEVLTIPVFYGDPILSPDARQLAYVGPGQSADTGAGILYTRSITGGSAEVYDEGQITLYAWSPDNNHFLYNVNGVNKIGSTAEPAVSLQVPGHLSKIKFFDPSHYLFVSGKGDLQQLWLGDLDGEVLLIGESLQEIRFDFVR